MNPTMVIWRSHEDGNCLVCSDGNEWLITKSNRMFVRPCYPVLFQECQANFEVGLQGIFVLGTPGIGKSAFLEYALNEILNRLQRSVLFLSGVERKARLFTADGSMKEQPLVVYRDTPSSQQNFANEADYVLLDPHEVASQTHEISLSMLRGKPFIVAMSPDENNCKKLRKDTQGTSLYMGPLSLEEALEMRSACYHNVASEELVRSRYGQIGGIARTLFARTAAHGFDSALHRVLEKQTKALQDIAENPIRIDGGEVSAQFKHLWSLYHLQPASPSQSVPQWYSYTIEPCCADLRIRIRNKLMEKEVRDLWLLFINTMERHGSLRGIRYEAYAHKKILEQGLNGRAILLTLNGEGNATKNVVISGGLPTVSLANNDLGAPFQNAVRSALTLDNGAYILPESFNFPVIDALYVSSRERLSLQMKAGRGKPLSGTEANTIYSAIGGCLVFIVPDESVIRRKVAYAGPGGGPGQWRHYRLVLNEA